MVWTETGRFHAGGFVLTVLGVTANHVALNLTDDHFDYRAAVDGSDHGANPYAGGSGVLTSGALNPGQVRAAYRARYAVTALCGGVLTWAGGGPVAAFAAFGMLASYGYPAPPVRYGYRSWGEVPPLVNFSLTLGLGSYCVQAAGAVADDPDPQRGRVGAAGGVRGGRDRRLWAVGPAAELLGMVGVAYLPAGMVVFRPRTT